MKNKHKIGRNLKYTVKNKIAYFKLNYLYYFIIFVIFFIIYTFMYKMSNYINIIIIYF